LCPSSEPESLPLLHLPFCYSLVGNLFEFRNPSRTSLAINRTIIYNIRGGLGLMATGRLGIVLRCQDSLMGACSW
jgi:hypothetical protein